MKMIVRRITFLVSFFLVCTTVEANGVFIAKNSWERYTSLCIAFPFTSWDYDTQAIDGTKEQLIPISFESTVYTFDYQAHHVSPKKGFTVLTRWGFGGWSGDYELSDGSLKEVEVMEEDEETEEAEEQVETFQLTDNTGFMIYLNLGFGKAFKLAKGHVVILPTAGVGLDLYMLNRAEGSYAVEADEESEDDTSTQESFNYRAIDLAVNIFLNVTATVMFSEKYGLSVSCQLSMPAYGINISSTSGDAQDTISTYSLSGFSGVNFTPAVGLCIRL